MTYQFTAKGKTFTATVASVDLAKVKADFAADVKALASLTSTTVRFECEGQVAETTFDTLVLKASHSIGDFGLRRYKPLAAAISEVVGEKLDNMNCKADQDTLLGIEAALSEGLSGRDARTVGEVVAFEHVEPALLEARFEENLAAAQKALGYDLEDEDNTLGVCTLDETDDVGFYVIGKDFSAGTIEVHFVGVDTDFETTIVADPDLLAADPMRFIREGYANICS